MQTALLDSGVIVGNVCRHVVKIAIVRTASSAVQESVRVCQHRLLAVSLLVVHRAIKSPVKRITIVRCCKSVLRMNVPAAPMTNVVTASSVSKVFAERSVSA